VTPRAVLPDVSNLIRRGRLLCRMVIYVPVAEAQLEIAPGGDPTLVLHRDGQQVWFVDQLLCTHHAAGGGGAGPRTTCEGGCGGRWLVSQALGARLSCWRRDRPLAVVADPPGERPTRALRVSAAR
jgi:hypothetical protein